jgi:2-polyprenyl-6-methoxyphenol hydroxylase-like FAD-dependent oxidoreductase
MIETQPNADGRSGKEKYDVVIVGGGPTGSTAATLLKKYNPDLRVLIMEKEKFPRDHVGESQLPAINPVLDEMGVWDKVEAAGFPIKLGAAFQNQKDLVAQVVAVAAIHLARLHVIEAGANLRRHQHVAVDRAVVIDFKSLGYSHVHSYPSF